MNPEQRTEKPIRQIDGKTILPSTLRLPILGARLLLGSLALTAGGSAAKEAINILTGTGVSVAMAASCLIEDRRTVIEFTNVGGDPNKYEPGIDAVGKPIQGATVTYTSDGNKKDAVTDKDGKETTRLTGTCVTLPNGQTGIKFTSRVTVADGRTVSDEFGFVDGKWQVVTTYIKAKEGSVQSATPTETPRPDKSPTPSGPTATAKATEKPAPTPIQVQTPSAELDALSAQRTVVRQDAAIAQATNAPKTATAEAINAVATKAKEVKNAQGTAQAELIKEQAGAGAAVVTTLDAKLNPTKWPAITWLAGLGGLLAISHVGLIATYPYRRRRYNTAFAVHTAAVAAHTAAAALHAADPIANPDPGLAPVTTLVHPRWFIYR